MRATTALSAVALAFLSACATRPPPPRVIPLDIDMQPTRVPHAPERQTTTPINALIFDKVFGPCAASQVESLNVSRVDGNVFTFPQRMTGSISCGVTEPVIVSTLKALGQSPASVMRTNGIMVANTFVPPKAGYQSTVTREYIDKDRLLACTANVLFIPAVSNNGPALHAGQTVLPATSWTEALRVPENMVMPLMGAQVLVPTGNMNKPFALDHRSSTLQCSQLPNSRIGNVVPRVEFR